MVGRARCSRLDARPVEWWVVLAAAVLVLAVVGALCTVDTRIVVVAGLLGGFVLTTLWQPFLGLLFYLAIVLTRPEEVGISPVLFHLERVAALAVVAGVVLRHVARRGRELWPRHKLNAILLSLLAVLCLSTLTAYWGERAVQATMELVKCLVPYLLIICLADTPRRLRTLTSLFILTIVWHGLTSYLGYHSGETVSLGEHRLARTGGLTLTLGDPNTMANLLVTGLPFAFVAVARGRGLWARVIGLAGIAATLPAIALTGSRTGVISLAVVLVLLAVHLRRRLLLFVVLVPSVLTIVWIHTPADLQNRYATILRPSGQITFVNRIHSIDIAMRMWATSPLLGVGPGNFGVARHGLYESDWHQAHNVAAQVGAELGLAGLAAFTCFIVVTFRALRRARRALGPQSSDPERVWGYWLAVAAEICLIALLVQGLASHNMYRFTYYFLAAVAVRLDLFAARLMATQSADTAQTVSRPSPL